MIFTHSVNVSVLSLITSLHFRLKREVIIDVALAGLLHDIGVAKMNPSILEKEIDLTEEEFIAVKKHPAYTVNILKNIEGISKNILYMCLQHHETLDGSGYPKNLTGKEILPLSQIISISEMYDALTSRKPYCKTISTSQAILYFYMTSGKHYHRKIANSFIKAIYERMRITEIFPLGSRIILNTNEIAIVMEETKNAIRPIIEIVKDSKQENLKRPIPVDLNNEPSREIIRVLKLPSGEDTLPEAKIILRHFF
jgi:HD-GYP domain-containing protein (c-di-GMP phosphodiesterase class II)